LDEEVELGYVDIPANYLKLEDKQKDVLADRMIDTVLMFIEKQLEPIPYVNRMDFLEQVLDSSIQTNVENEMYEIAAVFQRCKKRLNEV
jgi:hypothetical protein